MTSAPYPPMITSLPEADISFTGVRGWLSQAEDHQIVFMQIEAIGLVAPHRHGEQWGIVVDGEMELTIGGETRRYRAGDSYYIGNGVEHAARFLAPTRVIDMFGDRDRYRPKPRQGE